jgi:DNA-binding response OmpR family regulator
MSAFTRSGVRVRERRPSLSSPFPGAARRPRNRGRGPGRPGYVFLSRRHSSSYEPRRILRGTRPRPSRDPMRSASLVPLNAHSTGRILIVDDDPAVYRDVGDLLLFDGLRLRRAADGDAAIEMVRVFQPDLVLLAVSLPGASAFNICHRLRRQRPDLWIIMLTASNGRAEGVRAIETGADDFLTRPYSLRELAARIRVGLRRTSLLSTSTYAYGDIELDPVAHRVRRKGREVYLTPTEFSLLKMLAQRPGEVISREEFLEEIWGNDVCVVPRVIDTHIAALRRKLEDPPDHPTHLRSVRGVGYRLDVSPAEA